MIKGDHPAAKRLQANALQPSVLADVVVESIDAEEFLILPQSRGAKVFFSTRRRTTTVGYAV